MAEHEKFDPDRFLASLVFDPPGTPLDMPVPPRLGDDEQIMVHRELDLPPDADARLRAAAANRGMTVEQFMREWAEHAA